MIHYRENVISTGGSRRRGDPMNRHRVAAHLQRLVDAGELIPVTPAIPSREIFAKADARTVDERPMHPWTCEDNARAFVDAMRREGQEWDVVGGFGLGRKPINYARWHVWVCRGDVHLDPTWSRRLPETGPRMVPLARFTKYRYFALPGPFPEKDGLAYLSERARSLGVETGPSPRPSQRGGTAAPYGSP